MAADQPNLQLLGAKNAMANINVQTKNQRDALKEKENATDPINKLTKGVAGDLKDIFPLLDADGINEAAYNKMRSQTVTTTQANSYNPDFSNNINLNFTDAPTYDSLTASNGPIKSAKDKPSLIGPNLRSIGFDADGAPSIAPDITNLNRTTGDNPDNRQAIGTQGFGRFYRNVNNLGPRFANYLSNKFDIDVSDDPDLGKSKSETYNEGPIPTR